MKKGICVLLDICWVFVVFCLFTLRAYAASAGTAPPFQSMPTTNNLPTTSSTPTTTTSTGTNIDSRIVVPLGSTIQPATAQFATIKVQSTPLTQQAMSSLPTCPQTPVCPDINGNWPAGGHGAYQPTCPPGTPPIFCPAQGSTCPAMCSVTRTVQQQTLPNNIVSVVSSSAPVCPQQYVSTAVFNAGQEIVYQPAMSEANAAPYPISSVALYQQYISAGFTCKTIASTSPIQSCGNYMAAPQGPTMITAFVSGAYVTGAGIYTRSYNGGCFEKIIPYCSYAKSCNSLIFDMLYLYDYAYYKCYPPAGLYYSTNTVPTSTVCSLIQPTWQPSQ